MKLNSFLSSVRVSRYAYLEIPIVIMIRVSYNIQGTSTHIHKFSSFSLQERSVTESSSPSPATLRDVPINQSF